MANWDTFGDMKNRVREEMKDTTDRFFTQESIGVKINEGELELFKLIHADNRGFFLSVTPIVVTINSTTDTYPLGTDVAAIDEIIPVSDSQKFRKFDFASRHSDKFRYYRSLPLDQLADQSEFLYDVVGDNSIMIVPRNTVSFDANVYVYPEPGAMVDDADIPAVKKIFRNWIVQYAALSLKGSEEAGEQISHQQALQFLTTNLDNYISNRGSSNHGVADGYLE